MRSVRVPTTGRSLSIPPTPHQTRPSRPLVASVPAPRNCRYRVPPSRPMPNSLLRRYSSAMSASRTFTAAVHREEDWYVAQCLEADVASQGHTIDEALANLAEAVELYLEELDDPASYVSSTPLVTSFQLPGAA